MTARISLQEIFDAQKKHEEPLPSMEVLQQTVLNLISHHQNPDKILSEVLADVEPHDDANAHSCGEEIIDQLKHHAEISGVTFSSHSATWCATQLAKLLSLHNGSSLMEESLKRKAMVIIDVVRRCIGSRGLNRNLFVSSLNKQLLLGVEIVWLLNKNDIMSLDLFISGNLGRPEVMTAFYCGLVNIASKGEKSSMEYRRQILIDCIGYLAVQAYGDSCGMRNESKGVRKACISLLDNVTKEYLQNVESSVDVNIYEGAFESLAEEDSKSLQKFATRHLTLILGHDPHLQVSEALSNHSQWGYVKTPESLRQMFAQLMLVFHEREILEIFRQFLEEQEVNWKFVLAFVSTFLICYQGGAPVLQELIKKYLNKGLEACDIEGVISAFLIARHACSEGAHVFMTYAQWFQMTFSESSQNPANSKKSFSFLMKFLTDIMPFEKAEFLKIHLMKPPFVPDKCRPLMSDYVTLAKTRLMDLKDPFENVGIYEESGSGDSDVSKNQLTSDVEKAIAGFAKSGKVPLTVMEASMFRKPYYMGRFLPSLLKPRPLPDVPDDRMNFVEALWLANKIPMNLHNNYTAACQKEATQLLEGVFSDGDDSIDEMVMEPVAQLQHSLTKLKEDLAKKAENVTGNISMVADKIQLVLSTSNISKDWGKLATVDLHVPVVEPIALQTVDLILNCVCEIMDSTECSTTVTQLYLAVNENKNLMHALIVRLWDLLVVQGTQLDTPHLNGLTAVLIHLLMFPNEEKALCVMFNKKEATFQEHFISTLSVKTKDDMRYVLRLLLTYLGQAFCQFQLIDLPCSSVKPTVPPKFVQMFTYLAYRMFVPIRHHLPPDGKSPDAPSGVDMMQETSALHSSEQFLAALQATSRWTLLEWMKLECAINPKCDSLNFSERYAYHWWYLHKYHIKNDVDVNYRKLAKELILCLLELDLIENANYPGKPDLMKVLSEFINPAFLTKIKGQTTESPWFHDCLTSWLNGIKEANDKHGRICVFFSIIGDLPPHLLFTDDVRKVKETDIKEATELISDIMLNHLSEGITFDLKTLHYIIQGLAALYHHGHEDCVARVLKECPSIMVAVLVHWGEVSFSIQAMFPGETAVTKFFKKICNVIDLSRGNAMVSCLEGTWIEGLALFTGFLFRGIKLDEVSKLVLELVATGHAEVLEVWMTLSLCQIGYRIFTNGTLSGVEGSVTRETIRSCPISLRPFKGICSPPVANKVLPEMLTRVLPSAVARLFLDLEEEGSWPDVMRDRPHLLSDLIETHSSCVKLYHEKVITGQTLQSDDEMSEMEDLTALVKMISESIKICPLSHIKEIPKDVFRDCDYSIQVKLRKRLPKHFS